MPRCSTPARSSPSTGASREIYAREQYGRRGESDALWLVPRTAIEEIGDFVDEFDPAHRRRRYSIRAARRGARGRRDGTVYVSARVDLLLTLADDELILGWRNSEWTGIAPFLEEDVAFSSIAQNEIGHARALYELAARELGTDADALAFDRPLAEYRSAPLVELRRLEWARTIARHWLYETVDAIRLEALRASDDPEIAGIAAKIDREEVYHRVHAEMRIDRLLGIEEGRPGSTRRSTSSGRTRSACSTTRFARARAPCRGEARPADAGRRPVPRGAHEAELEELLDEMTVVRRSAPAGARW